jgi:hypothetical protein
MNLLDEDLVSSEINASRRSCHGAMLERLNLRSRFAMQATEAPTRMHLISNL